MEELNLKPGQYYYRPHRSKFGVWKVGNPAKNGARTDDFISDFATKIQASNFVKRMNGWSKPINEDNEE